MKRSSYRERDYAFGQVMLRLRTALQLTQAELAQVLEVSCNSVSGWEAGNKYPRPEMLTRLTAYAIEKQAFPAGREIEAVHSLWTAAHQKALPDEQWLTALIEADSTIKQRESAKQRGWRLSEHRKSIDRLPAQPTQLIGRGDELREIARILSEPACHLLTLLGPGGIGKTTLALTAAAEQAQRYRDGAVFVPLEAVTTSDQIISAIAEALEFSFATAIDPTYALMTYLRCRRRLVSLG